MKLRRWVWFPLAVLFLSLYLVGYRIYQHRYFILNPPATVLTEEQWIEVKVMDGETVNINTADEKELMRLPGVGKVMAKRICETRKELGVFQSVDDLKKVKGIGEGTYQKLKDYVVIE